MPGEGCQASIAHRRGADGATHDLCQHLGDTAKLAERFADPWGGGPAARLMGLWHDLGKYAADFQEMIRGTDADAHLEGVPSGPRPRVDHSTAGAQWAMKRFGPCFGRLLAYGIAGHHAGLPDWVGEGASRGLRDRLARADHLERALAAGPPADILDQPDPTAGLSNGADPSLWVRMIASALFDADFLDSEEFFDRGRTDARRSWPVLPGLEQRLDRHLTSRFACVAKTPVNALRADVLAACRAAADRPPGLFSLTVPTGGGKTLSSLAFALGHARRHGLSRVIYAIPFTSIIEQTADVFRKALGDDAVLEHHSALGPAPDQESARSRLAAENWDAPVIATTTVQLFESLFASRTSRVRKVHNLARSVLVLDEAQALPSALLRPATAVLDQLVRHYGVSVVLCTATQPALGSVFRELPSPTEIGPEPDRLFAALDRVTVALPQNGARQSWDGIASEMAEERQALAVVNTRKDCRVLHALLPDGAVHLSTWQCAAHRAELFTRVRQCLADGVPVRVVSTSLVEAGVDIDFPTVFRAMAGLDSLAQAAGRCNREGRLDKGRFVVFRPEASTPMKHVAQAIEAAEAALRDHRGAPFRPEAFGAYFREFYWAKGEAALDRYRIAHLLGIGAKRREGDPFDFRFRTAAEKFRMIEDDQETVVVPYGTQGAAAIARLRRDGAQRHTLRALQRFTVPVFRRAFDELRSGAAIEDVEGVNVLVSDDLYTDDTGLDIEGIPTLIA